MSSLKKGGKELCDHVISRYFFLF